MGDGHDRPSPLGERRIEMLAPVHAHALHDLFGAEAAHQQEVGEHAAVVLKRAERHPGNLTVRALAAERGRVVLQRGAPLARAEPEPRGSARRSGRMPEPRRYRPENSRTAAITSAEQARSRAWCERRAGTSGPRWPPPY